MPHGESHPLLVPGVCRFTLEGMGPFRPTANILDTHIDVTDPGEDRPGAIAAQARLIVDNWVDHMNNRLSVAWSAIRVSWVDLDNADGTTGQTQVGDTFSMPASGNTPGDMCAGGTALLISKQTSAGRGRRNGRMYVPGIPESGQLGGQAETTWFNGITTNVNDFVNNVNHNATGFGFVAELCVVHRTKTFTTINGVTYENGVFADIHSWILSDRLATQRRRQRK